ncbi:hypothetical protein Hypma_012263 [Hypsizygus marmoreus]|uniref:MYND-type domain-containing protein n=1 Tax=Hypsizygus marmoreus TaxID=39966 RepID=A0A369JPH3_HYPMA|nr:hypothetical protein Hypma_012263 [Hypsizygus marmoreus]
METIPNSSPKVRRSFLAEKFGFEAGTIKTDSKRWNKDWEKAIRSLSSDSPQTFFNLHRDRLRGFFLSSGSPKPETIDMIGFIENRIREFQTTTTSLFDNLAEGAQLRTAWMLLDDKEQRRHIQRGLEEACETAVFGQDGRAMCPEITITKLSKDSGKPFYVLVDGYRKGCKESDPNIHFTPNSWWDNVRKACGPATELTKNILTLMTLFRNDFFVIFTFTAGMSILEDFAKGSRGMDPVREVMNDEPILASALGKALAIANYKPIVRCENCTKTPDMIEGNPKFKLCSVCKSKLDFTIHYCSLACQKEDWPNHKKHCGREKVSKELKGTINDRYWMQPAVPDYIRHLPHNDDGVVSISELGFAKPDPLRPYSPALQRQVSLCAADKDVDYFLFNKYDAPIAIQIPGSMTKVLFRNARSLSLSSEPHAEHAARSIGEFLLVRMADHPGMNRERILAQMGREYGKGAKASILAFEKKILEEGIVPPGCSFLEKMGNSMDGMLMQIPDALRVAPH